MLLSYVPCIGRLMLALVTNAKQKEANNMSSTPAIISRTSKSGHQSIRDFLRGKGGPLEHGGLLPLW